MSHQVHVVGKLSMAGCLVKDADVPEGRRV
jgi:hypothetical protein